MMAGPYSLTYLTPTVDLWTLVCSGTAVPAPACELSAVVAQNSAAPDAHQSLREDMQTEAANKLQGLACIDHKSFVVPKQLRRIG
jgi:hypothetical protein